MPRIQFDKIWEKSEGRGCIGRGRAYILYELLNHVMHLPGLVAEAGVFTGGTSRLLACTASHKTVHLFDTFEGLPAPDKTIDKHRQGEMAASLHSVQKFLKDCNNVEFHKGFFPDTAKVVEQEQFCFVHLDMDLYKCTLDGLKFFYPRMTAGGILVCDDFNWKDCPGVDKAFIEFFVDKPEMYIPLGICGNQVMFIKQ